MTFAIRTADRSASLLPVIRETVARLNPNLPLVAVRTLDQQMEHHLRQERMFALFCVGFAVLAALVGHGPGDWSRRGEKFHEPSAESFVRAAGGGICSLGRAGRGYQVGWHDAGCHPRVVRLPGRSDGGSAPGLSRSDNRSLLCDLPLSVSDLWAALI